MAKGSSIISGLIEIEINVQESRMKYFKKYPEKQENSKRYGVFSLILSFLSLASVYFGMSFGFEVLIMGFTRFYYIIGNAVVIALGLLLMLLPLLMALYAKANANQQQLSNKLKMGVTAKIISVLSILIVLFAMVIVFVLCLVKHGAIKL